MTNHTTASITGGVWVTAQCTNTCGRVDLRPHEFTVLGGEAMTYTFTCPLCGEAIRRPATDAVLAVLALSQVREHHHAAAEARRGAA